MVLCAPTEALMSVRRLRQLFEVAFESSPSGIVLVDGAGRIVLVNRELERMFGYQREELVGQSIELLVPEASRGWHLRVRDAYVAAPQDRPMGAGREQRGRRKDGTELPVEIGLNPVETPEGTIIVGTVVDITARREAETRLRQSEKMEALGVMAGGIAHDFNNVLMAVFGYAELLSDAVPEPAVYRQAVDRILKASERGRLLVQRILTFTRQHETEAQVARLDQVVREALALVRVSLLDSFDVHEHFDPATPPIRCDVTQIQQVVMNLATNAAHAMSDRRGILDVSVSPFYVDDAFVRDHDDVRPGLYARLTVKDTGVGMPPEVLARLFEPFYTTRPRGVGTGLGMSMVHGIVSGHGGTIEVSSLPAAGTTVDVYLPAAGAESPAEARSIGQDGAAGSSPRILYVEDEGMLLDLARHQLEGQGYRLTMFESSIEALDRFRAHPDDFDLVVTDNVMPRMNGITLAAEVQKVRPGMRILMISGLALGLDIQKLKAKGIRWLLHKPHTRAELAAAIRIALETP